MLRVVPRRSVRSSVHSNSNHTTIHCGGMFVSYSYAQVSRRRFLVQLTSASITVYIETEVCELVEPPVHHILQGAFAQSRAGAA